MYHLPVLLSECVKGLQINPNGIYVDATFGGGGHSREILKRLGEEGHLFGFDQDLDAEQNIPVHDNRFTFVRSNFRFLLNWMHYYHVEKIDGLIADLGVSSHHLDSEERGFSFRFNAPLDMRMNKKAKTTAADIVNCYSERELATIFYLYGEIKNSRKISAAIVKSRDIKRIETIEDFLPIIKPFIPHGREKKYLAQIFQSLRIEVNKEMDALNDLLDASLHILANKGRLVILTYHSIEDRMVKNFIRAGKVDGKVEQDFFGHKIAPLKAVNNKVIQPSFTEQKTNPRSRSAKLRIAEKI